MLSIHDIPSSDEVIPVVSGPGAEAVLLSFAFPHEPEIQTLTFGVPYEAEGLPFGVTTAWVPISPELYGRVRSTDFERMFYGEAWEPVKWFVEGLAGENPVFARGTRLCVVFHALPGWARGWISRSTR